MAESGKKKKSKGKSQTKKAAISLNEFLAGDSPSGSPSVPFKSSKSWADETDDLDANDLSTQWPDERPKPKVNLSSLPSAPRAATVPNVDASRLPKNPPYTVFLGNLSYEANEDDIRIFFERNRLTVIDDSVRLVRERDGRFKGFGYAEFSSLNDLMEALSLTGLNVRNRPLQIDVAEGRNESGGGNFGGDGRRGYHNDENDRTSGDWRNAPRNSPPPPSSRYDRSSPPRDRGGYSRWGGGRDRYNGDNRGRRYSPPSYRRDYSPQGRRGSPPRRSPPRQWGEPPRRGSPPMRRDTSPIRRGSPPRGSPSRRSPSPQGRSDLSPNRKESPNRGGSSPRDDDGIRNSPPQERKRTPSSQRRSPSDRRTSPRRNDSPRQRSSPTRDSPDGFQHRDDYDRRDSDRSYGRDRGHPYDQDRSYGRNRPGGHRDESSFGQGWNKVGERSRQYNDGGDRYERGGNDRFDRGRDRYDRGGDRYQRGGERGRDRYDRGGDRYDRGGDRYDRGGDRNERFSRGGYRGGGSMRFDYRADRGRSPDDTRDDPPVERRKIVLQPRSKPLESEETSGQSTSSIFGGAKPVDTAKKEKEVEEKLQAKVEQERKLSEGGDESGSKKPSVFGDAKPVDTSKRESEIEERIREARETAENTRKDSSDHQRRGDQQQQSNRPKIEKGFSSWRKGKDEEPGERPSRTFRPARNDDDRPRRTFDNDRKDDGRGRGNRRGDGEYSVRGRGRGRSRGRGDSKSERPPQTATRKYEEPDNPEFEQANRFAALMMDEDDGDNEKESAGNRQDDNED